MTIHHAIIKLAAKQGIILTQEDDQAVAHHPSTNTRVWAAIEDTDDATSTNDAGHEALATCGEMIAWKNEPTREGVTVAMDDSQGEGEFYAEIDGEEIAREDTWLELLDAIAAYEPDESTDEDEDEDEPEPEVQSVVPDKYKLLYAEIGIEGQDNGDWMAALFLRYCHIKESGRSLIDCEKVSLLAYANGIDREPVPGSRGWEGRFRMTMGNLLRKRVADQGYINVPARLNDGVIDEIKAPAEFRAKWKTRKATKTPHKAKA